MADQIRALEFFCGIGGMHCALSSVLPQAVVLDAFDVSPIANDVYQHNFGRRVNKLDLSCITPQQLDSYAANLWMLSPPCQPHTRQGSQKGSQDTRSSALINLISALKHMQQPPKWLMLENVVGFDHSDVHSLLQETFAAAGYHVQEFILSPLQYGVPYTRPRYFCLASLAQFPVVLNAANSHSSIDSSSGSKSTSCPCQATPSLLLQLKQSGADQQTIQAAAQQHMASHVEYVQTISEYLWNTAAAATTPQQHQHQQSSNPADLHATCSPIGCCHTGSSSSCSCPQLSNFKVPESVLTRHAGVLRVVTSSSRNSNCFTKSYGHFARGTGSLLATVDPVGTDTDWQLAGGIGSLVHHSSSSSSSICEDGGNIVQYTLRPGEALMQSCVHQNDHQSLEQQQQQDGVILDLEQQQQRATFHFSLQKLLLGSSHISNASQLTTSSSSSIHHHIPVVQRPGELVIPSESRQIYSKHELQQLAAAWKELGIRYFTPLEIAQLHSFPSTFKFPDHLSVKQCYQLLGNSLSVVVVADLLQYLVQAV